MDGVSNNVKIINQWLINGINLKELIFALILPKLFNNLIG